MDKKTKLKEENKGLSLKDGMILGVKLSSARKSELLKKALVMIKSGKKLLIVTPNPEIIVEAQSDKKLKEVLNSAEISLPDGVGLNVARKLQKQSAFERIPGRVFMLDLLDICNKNHLKAYFLGSSDSVIKKCLEKARIDFPGLVVKGKSGPILDKGALPINSQEELTQNEVIKDINQFAPNILFLAFGAPKQEKWWNLHKEELNVNSAMVVGGSLDYYSGVKALPPEYISKLGLEWGWRFVKEPTRFKRILTAIVLFPIHVLTHHNIDNSDTR